VPDLICRKISIFDISSGLMRTNDVQKELSLLVPSAVLLKIVFALQH